MSGPNRPAARARRSPPAIRLVQSVLPCTAGVPASPTPRPPPWPAPAAEEEPALHVWVWDHVAGTVAWLDAANGRGSHETAMRMMKIAEESGEAVAAYIGASPRKGVTAGPEDLAGELWLP